MGWVVGARCYGGQQEAVDAWYSSAQPTIQVTGEDSYLGRYVRGTSPSGWVSQTDHVRGGVLQSTTTYPLGMPALPDCDPAGFVSDGLAVGWLIVGAMAAVYAVMMIRRAL